MTKVKQLQQESQQTEQGQDSMAEVWIAIVC